MIEQTDNKDTRHLLLLVDDNVQHLELLQAYMEALPDVEILTATNGLEAMEAVAIRSPDLILMDIMMPKMSGFEVCKRIDSSWRLGAGACCWGSFLRLLCLSNCPRI